MKRNTLNPRYEQVKTLPLSAMTVKQYADSQGYTTNYIYNMVRLNKNRGFRIVVFNTVNFIIPE